MKLTVHLEGSTRAELLKGLQAHLALFGSENTAVEAEETSHIDIAEVKKRTRKAAAVVEEEPASDDIDLGDEEKTPTLENDIIPAFQAYAKKHSREAAAKVLAKYKVKSVRDLPEAKFGEVIKTLGA